MGLAFQAAAVRRGRGEQFERSDRLRTRPAFVFCLDAYGPASLRKANDLFGPVYANFPIALWRSAARR